MKTKIILLVAACLFCLTTAMAEIVPDANGIVYVKKGGAGDNSGDSWANAIPELADALKEAFSHTGIKEIWVAKGTYTPMYCKIGAATATVFADAGRDNTFSLVKNVKVYGGFDPDAGISNLSHDRVLPGAGNPSPEGATVLSGDIDGDGTFAGNAYHVVVAAGNVEEALLDGFVITKGYGNETPVAAAYITINGVAVQYGWGAGIYNRSTAALGDCSPKYVNVSVIENKIYATSAVYGGGIYNNSATPEFFNVHIADNEAIVTGGSVVAYGGGVYNAAAAAGQPLTAPMFTNVYIVNNKASTVETSGLCTGGAMYSNNALVIFTNAFISGNSVSSSSGNAQGGGFYLAGAASPTLTNVTISGNTASAITGTASPFAECYGLTSSTIRNSVIYGNGVSALGTAIMENSLLQGQDATTNGNIAASAITGGVADLFTDPEAGDYTLKAGSPLIDAGNNDFFDLLLSATDLAGNARIQNDRIDIGAFEYSTPSSVRVPEKALLDVYPNPVSDVLYVKSFGDSLPVVKIYNLQGALALQDTGDKMDVSSLPAGIYIADINGERVKIVKK